VAPGNGGYAFPFSFKEFSMAYKKTKKLSKTLKVKDDAEQPKSLSMDESEALDTKKQVSSLDMPEEEVVDAPVLVKEAPLEEKIKEAEPPKDVASLPVAIPGESVGNYETTIALKTTVKRCGTWFKLVTGKKVTGTKEQIAYLRSCGLVK
jgi:hypothetical protein